MARPYRIGPKKPIDTTPVHGRLADEPLTVEDWDEVYWFIKEVYRPYLRRIVKRARERAAATTCEHDWHEFAMKKLDGGEAKFRCCLKCELSEEMKPNGRPRTVVQ